MTPGQPIVHIISHSHWDREWYLPFEQFRLRLVRLLDQVLELLEDPRAEFRAFHLDGYVLAIDDYLQIRPEQQERIRRHVEAKRLAIGPWYVLHDAFLTSGEAQLRNLHYGIERASQLGGATMIGYFPDTFGNHSQTAQILQEFGITEAVFGRGIAPVAENNTVRHSDTDDTSASELWWQAPNGDRVFSIFLANWYHNGMELPTDAEAVRARIAVALENVKRFATTPHLLLMNGCDHQPVQANVGKAIAVLNEGMSAKYIHSSFGNYLAAVREYEQDWPTARGELISARTDGWTTLVNTASARLYLKQANAALQRELERWVEPFATLAWVHGEAYPEAQIRYAWKLLLENHSHDGICGCSIDAVHDEMMTRFAKVRQVAEVLSSEALAALVAQVDTAQIVNDGVPLVVFNPLGWVRPGWVQATVDLDNKVPFAAYALFNRAGTRLAVSVEDHGWVDGFTLPPDRFRVVWRRRRYILHFRADAVPALGYTTFIWRPALPEDKETTVAQVATAKNGDGAWLENDHLRVDIHADGALTIHDKAAGVRYDDMLIFEDTGDIGNEYTYVGANNAMPILSRGTPAIVAVAAKNERAQVFITTTLPVPAARDGNIRSAVMETLVLHTTLSLLADSRRLEVEVAFDNTVRDHRLRVLFASDIATEWVRADTPFDVVRRPITPWEGWTNPSNCERMQSFFALSDGERSLAIAADGLPEYEVLRDGHNTMALTLLRSVGELGDWNYFPTPGAQCLGQRMARFAIISHAGDYEAMLPNIYSFTTPLRAVQTAPHAGVLPTRHSWLEIAEPAVALSAVIKAADDKAIIVRCVNLGDVPASIGFAGKLAETAHELHRVRANGQKLKPIEHGDDQIAILVSAKQIVSLQIRLEPETNP